MYFSGCSYPDPRGEGPPPPPRSYDDDYSANGYYDSYKEPPPPAPPQESLGSGSYYDRFYKKPPPSQPASRPPPPPGTNQAEPLYFWIWKKNTHHILPKCIVDYFFIFVKICQEIMLPFVQLTFIMSSLGKSWTRNSDFSWKCLKSFYVVKKFVFSFVSYSSL